VRDASAWLEGETNPATEVSAFEAKRNEVEAIASPIMQRLYAAGGSGGGGAPEGSVSDEEEGGGDGPGDDPADVPSVEEVD
jgi:L1 cell adhesion molecule like protein